MTNEEAIKKAYGEHWGVVKDIVDSEGWVQQWNHPVNNGILPVETLSYGTGTAWRPVVLQGIDTNNGWIRIYDESDLPNTEVGYCFVVDPDGITIANAALIKSLEVKKYWLDNATHYQPIVKPLAPVY